MKLRASMAAAVAAATLALSAPAFAGGFSVFGSYLDLDEPDGVAGLGVRLDVALGSDWTFDFTASFHQEAEVVLDTDLVQVDVVEEITFIPFDIGLRYHFGDSDGISPYLGFGASILEIDTKIGEGDALLGGYGVFGIALGDDIGAKFFIEGLYRTYEDVELALFEELDSTNRDEFAVDGFSAAVGVRWEF